MSIVCRRLLSPVLFCPLLVSGFFAMAQNQAQLAPQRLSLTAALVLTPEFCRTENTKGGEKFPVGKASCTELEPALKGVFTSLTRVDDSSKAGNAEVVLEPKFADLGTTQKTFAFSTRELDVLVEWTVRDPSGKEIWTETVQGSAKRHKGTAFTYGSNKKHILEDSVRDMAQQSAAKMSSSPELLKLSAAPVK